MKSRHAKVIIIGSGPAGYTAGIYAARAILKPLLIEGIQPGGQMTITTDVENYPGFADVIQGPWLMDQMRVQAMHVGTEIIADHIDAVDLTREPFWMKGDSGTLYFTDPGLQLDAFVGCVYRFDIRLQGEGETVFFDI